MTPKSNTPAADGVASGGNRDVLAGAERPDYTPPPGSITRPSDLVQDCWLRGVARDRRQGNAAFRVAWAVSTFLRRNGPEIAATLVALDAVAAPSRRADGASKWLRQGLLSLESGGHLWIDRSAGRGRGRSHRYALIMSEDLV